MYDAHSSSSFGCMSNSTAWIYIEDGFPSLHISWVVLDLEILPHPKKPSFSFLTRFYLTIKCRRLCLLKFPIWIVLAMPLPLSPMRWRAWTPNGFFRVIGPTRRYFWSMGSISRKPSWAIGPLAGISPWTIPTPFWICCLMPKFYLPLDVYQTL